MLKLSVIDANVGTEEAAVAIGDVASYVATWLKWEITEAGLTPAPPEGADIILFSHNAVTHFPEVFRRTCKRLNINPERTSRNQRPYIITGGAVDAAPTLALRFCDAIAIGEAYSFMRHLLQIIKDGGQIEDIQLFIRDYDHSIEAEQLMPHTERDNRYPWLLRDLPPKLASPDDWVDWEGAPLITGGDSVTRMIAAKGCHLKCKFCATTYRQTYRVTDQQPNDILRTIGTLQRQGQSVSLVSNDAAALPFFDRIHHYGNLNSQSITIKAIRDPKVLDALIRANMKAARFGVEGVSERIRQAFGKPIPNGELVDIIGQLTDAKKHVQLFYIMGSPFENDDDWNDMLETFEMLRKRLVASVVRMKFTAFVSCHPSPLGRFSFSTGYYKRAKQFADHRMNNSYTRHIMTQLGQQEKNLITNVADEWDTDRKVIEKVTRNGTFDFLPDIEMSRRVPAEFIEWPLPAEKRWNLANSYARIMGAISMPVPQ